MASGLGHGNTECVKPLDIDFDAALLSSFIVAVYCLAAFVPDFNSSIGIAAVFPLAAQFHTTTNEINDL